MSLELLPVTPELLCAELWDAHYGVEWPIEKVESFWARDLAIANTFCGDIFADDPDAATTALFDLLGGIGRDKSDHLVSAEVSIPPGWFHLFYRYYRDGRISAEVWGCAARNLFFTHGQGSAAFLPGLRAARPHYLMSDDEHALWRRLPSQVTLYRGATASTFDAAWQGVSWTPDPDYAGSYASMRTLRRYISGDADSWPRLIEAKVPRALVLGIRRDGLLHLGALQTGLEYLVDFEAMDGAMVREVAPIAPDHVPAHIAALVAKAEAYKAQCTAETLTT